MEVSDKQSQVSGQVSPGQITDHERAVNLQRSNQMPTQRQPKNSKPGRKGGPGRLLLFTLLLSFITGFLGGWLAYVSLGDGAGVGEVEKETVTKILTQEGQSISELAESVGKSVVSIQVESQSGFTNSGGISSGTGIIVDSEGLILTNKHVVSGNIQSLSVLLSTGEELDAELVDTDPFNDIAFVRASGRSDLQPAVLGDSNAVVVGQTVIAIGNALGEYQNSVTRGIISGIGRPVQAGDESGEVSKLQNLIQTDTAINPGNSGGPLLNMAGEVIGINTAVADAENIGFSIPINDAKSVLEGVKLTGKIQKPYIGVRYVMVNSAIKDQYNLSVDQGAYLVSDSSEGSIISGGPADKAGLEPGDVITEVDGKQLSNNLPLSSSISGKAVGDEVQLKIDRDGDTLDLTLTLEEYQD